MPKGPSYTLMNEYPSSNQLGGGMMPGFMSALSPSAAKISDLLRPLLKKIRPRIPASPARQIQGSQRESIVSSNGAPQIPAGAPFTSHKPENLDVIHFIANQSSHPAMMHVNQLFNFRNKGNSPGNSSPSSGMMSKGYPNHNMNINNINNFYNQPQDEQKKYPN